MRPLGAHDIQVSWHGKCDIGRYRKSNEDACLYASCSGKGHEIEGESGGLRLNDADFICAVSDGLGGANAGERASELAMEQLGKVIPQTFKASASGFEPDFLGYLSEAVNAVHLAINREASVVKKRSGMGATLSLCWFTPTRLWFAHIGDSRIYLFRNGEITMLTHDHTRVGHLMRTGILNERQAREHPRRHVLQQALGAGLDKIEPQFGSIGHMPGDWFLLCSDGLTDGLWDKNLAEVLSHAKKRMAAGEESTGEACVTLLDRSLRASGKDNTSLIVVGLAEV